LGFENYLGIVRNHYLKMPKYYKRSFKKGYKRYKRAYKKSYGGKRQYKRRSFSKYTSADKKLFALFKKFKLRSKYTPGRFSVVSKKPYKKRTYKKSMSIKSVLSRAKKYAKTQVLKPEAASAMDKIYAKVRKSLGDKVGRTFEETREEAILKRHGAEAAEDLLRSSYISSAMTGKSYEAGLRLIGTEEFN
jgi:hypothetical protein